MSEEHSPCVCVREAGRGAADLSPGGSQMKGLGIMNPVSLEFAGGARSGATVMGVGGVLFS